LIEGPVAVFVDVDDVGHGSFFDGHENPANDAIDTASRLVFFPLVQAEAWYWRRRARLESCGPAACGFANHIA
jgi:hypothetical protein